MWIANSLVLHLTALLGPLRWEMGSQSPYLLGCWGTKQDHGTGCVVEQNGLHRSNWTEPLAF
jgi:hypothetical protein